MTCSTKLARILFTVIALHAAAGCSATLDDQDDADAGTGGSDGGEGGGDVDTDDASSSGSGGDDTPASDTNGPDSGTVIVRDGRAQLTFASFSLSCGEYPMLEPCDGVTADFLVTVDIPLERLVPGSVELADPDVGFFQSENVEQFDPTCAYFGGGVQGRLTIEEVTDTSVRAFTSRGTAASDAPIEMVRCADDELPPARKAIAYVDHFVDGSPTVIRIASHSAGTCDDPITPVCPNAADEIEIRMPSERLEAGVVLDLDDPTLEVVTNVQRAIGGAGECDFQQTTAPRSGRLHVEVMDEDELVVRLAATADGLLDGTYVAESCL